MEISLEDAYKVALAEIGRLTVENHLLTDALNEVRRSSEAKAD